MRTPLVARPTAALFRVLSRLRRKRIAHPHGVGFAATLAPLGGGDTGAELFDNGEPVAAVVRLSRSAGLPETFHDPCGLALRVPDAYGPSLHQDFLLVSSGRARIARHLLLPSAGFADRCYSSLLPYRVRGKTLLVGAQPLDAVARLTLAELRERDRADLAFAITLASPTGRWREVATLHIQERLPEAVVERLGLNPAHSGGGLEPIGFLNALRPAAYRGSQAGRRACRPAGPPARPGRPSRGDAGTGKPAPETSSAAE